MHLKSTNVLWLLSQEELSTFVGCGSDVCLADADQLSICCSSPCTKHLYSSINTQATYPAVPIQCCNGSAAAGVGRCCCCCSGSHQHQTAADQALLCTSAICGTHRSVSHTRCAGCAAYGARKPAEPTRLTTHPPSHPVCCPLSPPPGKRFGLTATRNLAVGELLLVSTPLAVAFGPAGEAQPTASSQHPPSMCALPPSTHQQAAPAVHLLLLL